MSSSIDRLVLSGGAYYGFYELGVLKYLLEKKYIIKQNIKKIYGTSVGSFIGVLFSLQMDFDKVCDYFIERPWHKTLAITPSMLLEIISKKGLFDNKIFYMALEPLFKTCSLSLDITMKEFYEETQIDLYMYSVHLNNYKVVEFSHYTHPDLKLIDAIYMSCALPYLFHPFWYEDSYYVDGGLINNYPLYECLSTNTTNTANAAGEDQGEIQPPDIQQDVNMNMNILGIKFIVKDSNYTIEQGSNLFEYGYFLYNKMVENIRNNKNITKIPQPQLQPQPLKIKNEVIIPSGTLDLNEGYTIIHNKTKRAEYVSMGENYAKLFIEYMSGV
jgi:predicted patatin/cPLA2 family phospholipase